MAKAGKPGKDGKVRGQAGSAAVSHLQPTPPIALLSLPVKSAANLCCKLNRKLQTCCCWPLTVTSNRAAPPAAGEERGHGSLQAGP